MLARCAKEKREAVIDRLFDYQSEWAFAAKPLVRLKQQAMAAGMSAADVDACLKNEALLKAVEKEHDDAATKLRVKSTPAFFVNGVELVGEHALDKIEQILSAPAK